MAFEVHTRDAGPIAVIEAVGRLTLTDGHSKLRDLIHVSTGHGQSKFILNLAGVEYVDSWGIGELARCYAIVRETGGAIKLAGANQSLSGVLELARMNTIFEIYPGEGEALQSFGLRA